MAISLTIDGKQAALKKDSSIEYVSENRAFTDADDYSMEIELPLADCPQNINIFGLHTRRDIYTEEIFFDAVSRTITAPAVLAQSGAPTVIVQENNALRETIAQLNQRLNEPFVTINTVTGDMGIKQAQDDYQRLINNKSPKNKRK